MIKFFRKIRQNLVMQDKTSKYFKYAIGEITLVVIGILIALQINNWNENNNKKKQLNNIYTIIDQNFKTDLKNITNSIAFYQKLDSTLYKILTTEYPESFLDGINEKNYLECVPCKSNISYFFDFEIQNNGIELLKKYENNESTKGDDFSQELIEFHTQSKASLESIISFIEKEAYSNFKFYEQFPWYASYSLNKYNSEAISYFLTDQTYKNKVANFKILIGRNYLKGLLKYQGSVAKFIAEIEKRRLAKY
jgi:hypothetical protein